MAIEQSVISTFSSRNSELVEDNINAFAVEEHNIEDYAIKMEIGSKRRPALLREVHNERLGDYMAILFPKFLNDL